ncbi:MAG TPA: serpin family protein [Longimicrobiales bacterium]|nr:serpin family protein [Longimicrobiales bacterium]
MSTRRLVLALLPFAALAGCGEPIAPGPPEALTELPRDLSASEAQVIRGSNAFAFDFLRSLFERREGGNVFASPLSASMALGMTMNGADGETWTQMREVLGFDGMTEPEINEAYHDLIALLLALDPSVTFGLGNSIWADDSMVLLPDFVTRVQTWFDAEARTIDFQAAGAKDIMNAWVSEVTQGRIDQLLATIPPDVVMYLINAVYFRGDWRDRFDRGRTASASFTTLDGDEVAVPMMAGEVGHRFFFGPDATVLELPYGADAFTAVAVLPPEGQPMAVFLDGLTPAVWQAWMDRLAGDAEARAESGGDREGILVRMPKLELEWEAALNEPLVELGMTDAFDERLADFTRLTGEDGFFIEQALQKTFLKVDEEGTEAAAATAVGMGVTSAPPSVRLDRPFVFAIRERLSGTILFLGVIGDPSA